MIDIKSLRPAVRTKRRYDAVISIEDPGYRRPLRFHRRPHPAHLVLKFEDIDHHEEHLAGPDEHHVSEALRFARDVEGGRLLIHCHAGICRSTAIGLAIIADRLGQGDEERAVATLVAIAPQAVPNIIVVEIADRILTRGGALVAALREAETVHQRLHRERKAQLVRDQRHRFAARPPGGFYRAWRPA